jgi:hypothetical protein
VDVLAVGHFDGQVEGVGFAAAEGHGDYGLLVAAGCVGDVVDCPVVSVQNDGGG